MKHFLKASMSGGHSDLREVVLARRDRFTLTLQAESVYVEDGWLTVTHVDASGAVITANIRECDIASISVKN